MSVVVPTSTATSARDLLVLYSKKAAFTIDEYADCGLVYKRLNTTLEKDTKSKEVQLEVVDAKFVVSAINVCSLRVPTEVANYKVITDLLETLTGAMTQNEKTADATSFVDVTNAEVK